MKFKIQFNLLAIWHSSLSIISTVHYSSDIILTLSSKAISQTQSRQIDFSKCFPQTWLF